MNLVDFSELIVKKLVKEPDLVKVQQFEDNDEIVIEIAVSEEDMGRVIGKKGKIATSIKTLIQAKAYNDGNNKVKVKTSISQWRWILIYSRALPIVTSLDEEIDIDRYTLALLRQFIKMDYALDAQNDTTLNKYYSNRLESRIEAVNKMFANNIQLYITVLKQNNICSSDISSV